MRIKVPQTIVTFPRGAEIVVYNYLTKDAITCAPADVYWLTAAPDWISVDDILAAHPHIEPQSLRAVLQSLIDTGILIVEGTPAALQEESYNGSWELGRAAALFHFAILDNEYDGPAASTQKQKQRALTDPSPQLFLRNSDAAIALPKHEAHSYALMDIMKKRRTNRIVNQDSISLLQLSDCLYSGLGITGFVKTETCVLPLKMTPSGGARNPYEAYVWARNVSGLSAGIYHYSALDHTLEKVDAETNLSPSQLLAGQDWADNMAAVVFLVADLRRTTWKYNDPNAYRVVLIEAGHVAQNMMLTCTDNDLTGCPTAALCHSQISSLLGLTSITQTPIYALTIGKPEISTDVFVDIETVRQQHAMQ